MDLAAWLDEGGPQGAALPALLAELRAELGADQTCAFLVTGERKLEFFHGEGMPAGIVPAYQKWLPRAPEDHAAYDPGEPDPRQRNVALRTKDVLALTRRGPTAVVRKFLPRFALSESDQLRVLVCEGPSLLAWVGGFRAHRFSKVEQRKLQELTPALQRRLSLERRLQEAGAQAAETGAALENVPAAVFIQGRSGAVVHANVAGRALLERDRAGTLERLEHTASKARLAAGGELRLAVLPALPEDPLPRAAVARSRWGLTARQTEVLILLAQGLSNRAISAALGCVESTVELHVTALLNKSGCDSRSQLVARLWSGA